MERTVDEIAKDVLNLQAQATRLGLHLYLTPQNELVLGLGNEVFYRNKSGLSHYFGFLAGWEHAQKWHNSLHPKGTR